MRTPVGLLRPAKVLGSRRSASGDRRVL